MGYRVYVDERLLAKAFIEKWPNVCRDCGGAGGFIERYKPAPGPGYLEDFSSCASCIDKGICPRCGAKNYEDWVQDEVPCPECGWDWCKNEDDFIPVEWM